MNTKISFIYRTLLVSVFVIALLAAVPAGAVFIQSPDGLASPAGWAAIHPPFPGIMAIVFTQSGSNTTEAGTSVTINVSLDTAPTEDVIVPVASSVPTEGTVSPSSLTFTTENYATPQAVTVSGVNDDIDDGDIPYSVDIGPGSSGDNPLVQVALTNTDDDTAGYAITTISGATTEAGGTATFTVALTSEPLGDVTIGVSSNDTTEGTVSPASLTFNNTNWATTQTVTVTGVNDAIDDGNVIFSIVLAIPTGDDATYNTLDPADVSVTNNDDTDAAGITVTPTSGLVTTEVGGTATFTVVLTSQPIADDVTIGITSGDTTEGTVSPASLIFNSTNWTTTQLVTVTGVNDAIDDGNVVYNIITANPTGSDATYNAINPNDVSVTNNDDTDAAGITVTPTSGLVTTEAGGTATFTVVLESQPQGVVDIGISSSLTSEGTVSPATLTFNGGDWDDPLTHTVTVSGVDDSIADGDIPYEIITAPAVSTGNSDYDGFDAENVSVTNTDDDVAGFTIDPTEGLVTTEAGDSATFEVSLKSEPIADVMLNLSSDDVTEGESSPTTLTFDATNWNVAQVVTVTGVDDYVIDGDVTYTIVTDAATSSDPNYDTRNPPNISVTNGDDDVARILVDPINGLITTEGGGTATFSVVLDSQPSIKVDISLETSDTTEGSVSPESLTFTVGNWDIPQTVTITGKNDNKADGSIVYTILTHPATSADDNYNGVDADDVEVTNADDDTAGITVAPLAGIETTEGELEAKISTMLNTEPQADVIFTFTSNDTSEGVFFPDKPDQPMTITFTPDNWDTIQDFYVYGVDDLDEDGDTAYTIQVITQSGDPDYTSITKELSAVNEDAASIQWVLPENHDPYYETSSPDLILLGVEKLSEEPISEVRFYRWDRDLGIVRIGEIKDNPDHSYQLYIDPKYLDYNWNQIYAYAIDDDGDPTQSRHELLRIYRIARLYLPSIHK